MEGILKGVKQNKMINIIKTGNAIIISDTSIPLKPKFLFILF